MNAIKTTYTVSARGKLRDEDIFKFINRNYSDLPFDKIESFFGFVERSTLYGGRIFDGQQISSLDVFNLNSKGIGVRLPFTNHFATFDEYKKTRSLLNRYYDPVNSVICYSDELAGWIKNDYPDFDIEASVIKNISNLDKIEKALKLYDTVVLPMISNDDDELLDSISDKSRIRLFANGGCAYTCPSKICYRSFSKANKPEGGETLCSQTMKYRENKGVLDFDISRLEKKAFTNLNCFAQDLKAIPVTNQLFIL